MDIKCILERKEDAIYDKGKPFCKIKKMPQKPTGETPGK